MHDLLFMAEKNPSRCLMLDLGITSRSNVHEEIASEMSWIAKQ